MVACVVLAAAVLEFKVRELGYACPDHGERKLGVGLASLGGAFIAIAEYEAAAFLLTGHNSEVVRILLGESLVPATGNDSSLLLDHEGAIEGCTTGYMDFKAFLYLVNCFLEVFSGLYEHSGGT